MLNTTYALAFETLLVLVGVMSVAYLIFIRVNREAVRVRYKPGAPGHELHRKLYKPASLVISVLLTLLFTLNLLFAMHRDVQAHDSLLVVVSIPVFCVVLGLVIFFTMYASLKKK